MSPPKPPTQEPPPAPPSSPFGRLQLSTFLATGLVALVAVGIALASMGTLGGTSGGPEAPSAPPRVEDGAPPSGAPGDGSPSSGSPQPQQPDPEPEPSPAPEDQGQDEAAQDLAVACVTLRGVPCPDLSGSPSVVREWRACRASATAEQCLSPAVEEDPSRPEEAAPRQEELTRTGTTTP